MALVNIYLERFVTDAAFFLLYMPGQDCFDEAVEDSIDCCEIVEPETGQTLYNC